jgi:TolB-like protein/tetratricopeptide (TPR) repeat protein/predicted Ser/Thr protein kinase
MTVDQWQKVERLYHCVSAKSPDERDGYLESVCGGDALLRREVESLLAYDDRAANFLESNNPVQERPGEPCIAGGEQIGPYVVTSLLAKGGMGEVYKGYDPRLDRTVAIKFLPEAFAADNSALERFKREARAASALNHPRICTVYDIGDYGGRPFFVMEFVEGQSLRDRIGHKPLPVSDLLDLAQQICDALRAAHEKGIIHRDIKPANIFVTTSGQVKILDFGIAKLLAEDQLPAGKDAAGAGQITDLGITSTRFIGTPAYLSPEQVRGGSVDQRTDVYALGVVLYQMATGNPVFRCEKTGELIGYILHQPPDRPSASNRAISGQLERIILKALEKDPSARYQSAGEVRTDLEKLRTDARTRRWLLGSATAVVAFAGGTLLMRFPVLAPRTRLRVAVLPLESLDSDPKQAYFAEGLHEELISTLGRLYPDGLGIIARGAVRQYQGTKRPIDQIGRELKVDYVVEGGVRRDGNKIRITAHLIRAKDQTQLWSGSYDRDLSQALVLQAQVAQAVARGIERSLRPSAQVEAALARPLNSQAHEAYLRRDYSKAVQIDPTYASAHAALAGRKLVSAIFGFTPPMEGYQQAKETASKALQLDPTLADAHSTLALAKLHAEWKWREAEEGMLHALALDPNNVWVRHMFAHFLLWDNRSKESAEECSRALDYAPTDPDMVVCTAWHQAWAGEYDQALAAIRGAFSIHAENRGAMLIVGWAYEQKGMFPEAISAMEKFFPCSARTASMAHALAVWGNQFNAEQLLDQLLNDSKKKSVSAYDIAVVYVGLGDHDRAFDWLNKACEEHAGFMPYIRSDPRLKPLRADRRFQNLLRRMGCRNLSA